jgi:hypothetical protein
LTSRGAADIAAEKFDSAFNRAAISAVKQWRFSPTLVDGKAVPVKVIILFARARTPTELYPDRDSVILLPLGNTAAICSFVLRMDRSGNFRETSGDTDDTIELESVEGRKEAWSKKKNCGDNKLFILLPDPGVSFAFIGEKMKAQITPAFTQLDDPQCRYPLSESIQYAKPGLRRLYYSVMLAVNGSQLIQLAGVDPEVKPPEFKADFKRLAESPDISHYKMRAIFFYTLFVDEHGRILGVEVRGAKNETVEKELSDAMVIKPGMRKGVPVPTAVIRAMSEK